jgi:hypothetical protein
MSVKTEASMQEAAARSGGGKQRRKVGERYCGKVLWKGVVERKVLWKERYCGQVLWCHKVIVVP